MCAQLAAHHSSERARYRWAFRQKIGVDQVAFGRLPQPVTTDHAGIGQRRQAQQFLADRHSQTPAVEFPNAAHDLASPAVYVTGEQVWIKHQRYLRPGENVVE